MLSENTPQKCGAKHSQLPHIYKLIFLSLQVSKTLIRSVNQLCLCMWQKLGKISILIHNLVNVFLKETKTLGEPPGAPAHVFQAACLIDQSQVPRSLTLMYAVDSVTLSQESLSRVSFGPAAGCVSADSFQLSAPSRSVATAESRLAQHHTLPSEIHIH